MATKLISFTQFSKEILESGDIDPDYHFMREFSRFVKLSKADLLRWIMLKTVVYRSTSELQLLLGGKGFDEVKYGNERNKHKNRAEEFYAAVYNFFSVVKPEELMTMKQPLLSLKQINGFGSWASWKLVDLLDCVYGLNIDLSGVDFRQAYEFPLKGLCLVNDLPEDPIVQFHNEHWYAKAMKSAWKQMPKIKRSPHNGDRGIRINELETCLCKYHSYVHGHYYAGKDLEHLKKDIAESDLKQLTKFKWSL